MDALNDVVSDMPSVTPVADIISKEMNDEQARNDLPQNSPEPKKRGRGRPPKNKGVEAVKTSSRIGGVPSQGELDNASRAAERLAAAQFCVAMIENSGVALAGEDARMQEMEKAIHIGAWDKYLEKVGVNDIPPGVALCLVTGQYLHKVTAAPLARPKMQVIKEKIHNFFWRLKNARSMRWNDGQRKNDARKETPETVQSAGDKKPSP